MPEIYKVLYKTYPHEINGIVPLVPAIWTSNLGGSGLQGIEQAYPSQEEVKSRVNHVLKLMKEGPLVFSNKKETTNPKPLEDLIGDRKELLTFNLVRDYNGEYAPCIGAAIGGGRGMVIACRKPLSRKAVMSTLPRTAFNWGGYSEDDEKAADEWIQDKFKKDAGLVTLYAAEELKRQNATLATLFTVAGLKCEAGQVVSGAVSMNALHQFWNYRGTLRKFYTKVDAWTLEKGGTQANALGWMRTISRAADTINRVSSAKPTPHKASLAETATVKPPVWITYAMWIRLQPPKNHTHNMGQDLLLEIVTAISHVSAHVYPGCKFRFLLFGDQTAQSVSDLPVHGGEKRGARKIDTKIPDFIADLFLEAWKEKPEIQVVDLRDLYSAKAYPCPDLETFAQAELPDATKAKEFNAALAEFVKTASARKGNMTYWEQYAFFHSIDQGTQPRFIIGAESGNMDGFGYCGIPVISVDVEDEAAVDESLLTDRIGQYSFLTPLWNLLNFHKGKDLPVFRQHLYGAILHYTRYAGALHGTKKPGTEVSLPQDDFADIDKLKDLFSKKHEEASLGVMIEESLAGTYKIVNATGDGNCLFRALSIARDGDETKHGTYRRSAVNYAAQNFSFAMIDSGSGPFNDLEEYKRTMGAPAADASDTTRYGGFVETEAFALRYDLTIEVYSPDFLTPVVVNAGKATTLRIFYVNGNHYKALLPKT